MTLNIHKKCLSLDDINKLLFDLDKFLALEDVSEDNLFKIKLIYEELLLNCWYHGHDHNCDCEAIEFEINIDGNKCYIELLLKDNTSHFDYDKFFTKSDTKSVGGYGISLIENFCDKWEYSRVGKYNVNILRILL